MNVFKRELLVRGDVSEREVQDLNNLLNINETEVFRYETKGAAIGGIEQIVHLIVNEFNPITFTRDFLLGASLNYVITIVRKTYQYFSKKKISIADIFITIEIQCEGKTITLQFFYTPKNEKEFIQQLQGILTDEFIGTICSFDTISFEQENNQIRVFTLKD